MQQQIFISILFNWRKLIQAQSSSSPIQDLSPLLGVKLCSEFFPDFQLQITLHLAEGVDHHPVSMQSNTFPSHLDTMILFCLFLLSLSEHRSSPSLHLPKIPFVWKHLDRKKTNKSNLKSNHSNTSNVHQSHCHLYAPCQLKLLC